MLRNPLIGQVRAIAKGIDASQIRVRAHIRFSSNVIVGIKTA